MKLNELCDELKRLGFQRIYILSCQMECQMKSYVWNVKVNGRYIIVRGEARRERCLS